MWSGSHSSEQAADSMRRLALSRKSCLMPAINRRRGGVEAGGWGGSGVGGGGRGRKELADSFRIRFC